MNVGQTLQAAANPAPLVRPTPPELYKDYRLGKYDSVVWGRPNGEVKIGRIEKLSKVTKKRTDDGADFDQSGDPHFYYVYPKFHPDESIFKIRPIELKISDRYLKVGFVVKESETGRIGYVQGIKQQITVKLLEYDLIIRDIEFRELTDPWKLNIQYKRPVYYNGWVGRISCPVQRRVWLRFIDRRVRAFSFSIPWNELAHILIECGIVKMATFSFESSGFAFWPGKKYKIPKSLLTNSKYNIQWDDDIRPMVGENDGPVIIRVVKTEVMPFRVQWSKRIPGFDTERPKEIFREEQIQDVVFIRPVQVSSLGDVRMYRIKSDDYQNLITEETWKMILRRRYWLPKGPGLTKSKFEEQLENKPTLSPLELNEELPVEIIYTRSTAEVAWADGKISRIDSSKVCRVRSEYFEVGTFVEPVTLPGINTFGVIQQVKVLEKGSVVKDMTAIVKWFYFGNDEDPDEQTYETELPIKLLRGHSKFNFKSHSCMNVIVSRGASDQEFTVGYVVNTYPDGKVRVRCVDGCTRRFWPFEISRVYLDSSEIHSSCSCSPGDKNKSLSPSSCSATSNLSSSKSSLVSISVKQKGDSSKKSEKRDVSCASSRTKEIFLKPSQVESCSIFSMASTNTSNSYNCLSNQPPLNSLTWRKAIKQASLRNLSWKEQMALKELDDKSCSNSTRNVHDHPYKSAPNQLLTKYNNKVKN